MHKSAPGVHAGEKMVPPKSPVLHTDASLIDVIRHPGCRPEVEQVDVEPPFVRTACAEGALQPYVFEDLSPYRLLIRILRYRTVVGALEPLGPLRYAIILVPIPEPGGMAERQRTDSVHQEPWQQKHGQVQMDASVGQIERHSPALLRWSKERIRTVRLPQRHRSFPSGAWISVPTTSTAPTPPRRPWR